MRTFHQHSDLMAAFVVSIYILGYVKYNNLQNEVSDRPRFAVGPLVVAPLSELYGRSMLYHISNLLFVIFNVACAVSSSFGMLVAFRFLAGCAGATPLTLGGGTIADMCKFDIQNTLDIHVDFVAVPPQKRAGAMALWAMGPLIGPVLGPVCGGFLVQHTSWRWVFWILAILGGLFGAILVFVSRETYHPIILEKKAARLRKETGNPNLRSKLAINIPAKEIFVRAISRPMKMLLLSPIVGLMSLYVAVNYGILYLFFTTVTFVFEGQYHFSSGAVGLSYLGVGVGMIVGMTTLGIVSDRIIQKQQLLGDVKPEHRLPLRLTMPGAIGLPIGVLIYGWTTHFHVHWIVPIIATSLIGLGNLTAIMTIQTYLIDAFTIYAASAVAANTILRSLFGAVLPLCGLSMYNKLGLGWGNTLLAFVALIFVPVPVFFKYYGERIRTSRRFQVQF